MDYFDGIYCWHKYKNIYGNIYNVLQNYVINNEYKFKPIIKKLNFTKEDTNFIYIDINNIEEYDDFIQFVEVWNNIMETICVITIRDNTLYFHLKLLNEEMKNKALDLQKNNKYIYVEKIREFINKEEIYFNLCEGIIKTFFENEDSSVLIIRCNLYKNFLETLLLVLFHFGLLETKS